MYIDMCMIYLYLRTEPRHSVLEAPNRALAAKARLNLIFSAVKSKAKARLYILCHHIMI